LGATWCALASKTWAGRSDSSVSGYKDPRCPRFYAVTRLANRPARFARFTPKSTPSRPASIPVLRSALELKARPFACNELPAVVIVARIIRFRAILPRPNPQGCFRASWPASCKRFWRLSRHTARPAEAEAGKASSPHLSGFAPKSIAVLLCGRSKACWCLREEKILARSRGVGEPGAKRFSFPLPAVDGFSATQNGTDGRVL